jgi:hypothetical protein
MRQLQRFAAVMTAGMFLNVTGADGTATTASVLEVQPVYAAVAAYVPYRQCWRELPLDAAAKPMASLAQAPAVRRCILLQRSQLYQEQVGFRVKYRYRGRVGTLLTGLPPETGDRIGLRHHWRPIFF